MNRHLMVSLDEGERARMMLANINVHLGDIPDDDDTSAAGQRAVSHIYSGQPADAQILQRAREHLARACENANRQQHSEYWLEELGQRPPTDGFWQTDRERCPRCGSSDLGFCGSTGERTEQDKQDVVECNSCKWEATRPDEDADLEALDGLDRLRAGQRHLTNLVADPKAFATTMAQTRRSQLRDLGVGLALIETMIRVQAGGE